MSLQLIQEPTNHNAAYTRLLYTVSGSIYTDQPQYQYVCDVYSGSILLKRMTQPVNPAGTSTFDVARIVQGALSVDYNWKTSSITEMYSSSKTFRVKLGEQFGTSISSSVTVYPDQTNDPITVNQSIVEPNAGTYNLTPTKQVLSNMPSTMSMQSDDYGTISIYNDQGTYISQSFYSASSTAAEYDLVEQKNYTKVTGTYFNAVPISSSANYWNYVDVSISSSYGTENYRYEASDETHREKTRFAFVNKLGAWDYYNNYNPVRQAIDVKREQYTAPRVDYSSLTSTYDISRRGLSDYHNSTNDSFVVDTDYLDKINANWLEELIESPSVYIQRNGEFLPIVINDSNYIANTNQARQKLFKYSITFTPSNQPFGKWVPEYVECPKAFDPCDYTINTVSPSAISSEAITMVAYLTASAGNNIYEVGFYYSSTSTSPGPSDSVTTKGGVVAPFTASFFDLSVPGLTGNTTYYYRGYGKSGGCDTKLGNVIAATTLSQSFDPFDEGTIDTSSLLYWFDFTNSGTGSMSFSGSNYITDIENKGTVVMSLTTGSTSKYTSNWVAPTHEDNYSQFYGSPTSTNSALASIYGTYGSSSVETGFNSNDVTTTIYFTETVFDDPNAAGINLIDYQTKDNGGIQRFQPSNVRNQTSVDALTTASFSSTVQSPVSASGLQIRGGEGTSINNNQALLYSYSGSVNGWESRYIIYSGSNTAGDSTPGTVTVSRQPSETIISSSFNVRKNRFVEATDQEGFVIGGSARVSDTDSSPFKLAHYLMYTGSLTNAQITNIINSFKGSVPYGSQVNAITN